MSSGNSWEKQSEEKMLWFNRFDLYYRPIGPERTLLGAYNRWRVTHGKNPAPAPAPSSAWTINSKKYRWTERAEHWDTYQIKLRHDAEQEAIEEARVERKAMIRGMKAELALYLNSVKEKLLIDGNPSINELVRYTEMVLREERAELGDMPVSRHDVTTDGKPIKGGSSTIFVYGNLDLDQL